MQAWVLFHDSRVCHMFLKYVCLCVSTIVPRLVTTPHGHTVSEAHEVVIISVIAILTHHLPPPRYHLN